MFFHFNPPAYFREIVLPKTRGAGKYAKSTGAYSINMTVFIKPGLVLLR